MGSNLDAALSQCRKDPSLTLSMSLFLKQVKSVRKFSTSIIFFHIEIIFLLTSLKKLKRDINPISTSQVCLKKRRLLGL